MQKLATKSGSMADFFTSDTANKHKWKNASLAHRGSTWTLRSHKSHSFTLELPRSHFSTSLLVSSPSSQCSTGRVSTPPHTTLSVLSVWQKVPLKAAFSHEEGTCSALLHSHMVSPPVLAFFTPKDSESSKHLFRFVPRLMWLGSMFSWPPFKVPLWQKRFIWWLWRLKRNWVHSWKPWVCAMSAAVRPLAFLRLYNTKTMDYTPQHLTLVSAPAKLTKLSEGNNRSTANLH